MRTLGNPFDFDDPPDGPAGARALRVEQSDDIWPTGRGWPRCDPYLYPLRRGVRVGHTRFYGVLDRVPTTDPDGGSAEGIRVRITKAESDAGEPLEFGPEDVAEALRLLRMAA